MSTATAALASSRQQTQSARHTPSLLSILTWELRRFLANRLFWIQAIGFFCFLLLVFLVSHNDISIGYSAFTFDGSVAISSPWGIVEQLPTGSLMLLCMLLPFINADGVTRDLTRRTHELLMTTAVPNWAYVWGRYLIGLVMSLGLAIVLLVAILGLGLARHLTDANYPAPVIGPVLLLWVGMVLPAVILVSNLSFALGTIFPRQSTLIKIAVLFGWFFGALIVPAAMGLQNSQTPPAWYSAWDPTSAVSAAATRPQYDAAFSHLLKTATSLVQAQHDFLTVENMVPNVSAWFAQHLILGALSLVFVALAAFTFQRFRNALSAS
jgi:ABC-type transport system involved in multi-copper enzyme maturation permease subunit